jgi:hypothetical protein
VANRGDEDLAEPAYLGEHYDVWGGDHSGV